AGLAAAVQLPGRPGLPDRAVAVRARHRRAVRGWPRRRPAGDRAVRQDRLHHRHRRRGAGTGRPGRAAGDLHDHRDPRVPDRADRTGLVRQAARLRPRVHARLPGLHRRRRGHQADPADRTDHAVPLVRRLVAGGQLRAGRPAAADLGRGPPPAGEPAAETAAGRGDDGGGPVNRPIRRVALAMLILFGLLIANANYVQVFEGDRLRTDPGNTRVLLDEYERQRGTIVVEGRPVAESVPTNDKLKYLRRYPGGSTYAPVTGFYSLIYGATGIEQAENDFLSGNDNRLFTRRLSALLTGRDPRGGNVVLTLNQ